MEDKKREIYGDNFLDDSPSYRDTKKISTQEKINSGAVVYGAGLALAITFVTLLLGFLWAEAVQSVAVNYSFLVDLCLAGSVLFGSFKGAIRAKSLGLAHGALVGLVYSATGILILAVALPVNWFGALETVAIATFIGSIGGIAGLNLRAGRDTKSWQKRFEDKTPADDYDLYDDYVSRR